MPLDAAIRKRDALIIPGGLLLFYSLLAIVYAEAFRARSDFCPDGSWILINSVCYTVWKLLLPVVLIGLAMVIGGAVAFRGKPEQLADRLHHGSPSHFVLALLVSLVAVPFLLLLVQLVREGQAGTTFVIELYDIPFKHTFLLGLATLLAALILVPYLGAYLGNVWRRQQVLRAVDEGPAEEPVYDGPLPHEEGYVHPDEYADDEWPEDGNGGTILSVHPASAEPVAEKPRMFPGKNYDVEEIEGIGHAYARRLAEVGIRTTLKLRAAQPGPLAQQIGVNEDMVRSWQAMAELMAVKGIGPQYAEALVVSGVGGIDDLKRRSPAGIARQVTNHLNSLGRTVVGTAITEARVAQWKEAASSMRRVVVEIPDA